MKKILYVTGSRAEYGIVRRLLTMLRETPEIQLDLAVTGMHCDNAYGNTIHIIEQAVTKATKLTKTAVQLI